MEVALLICQLTRDKPVKEQEAWRNGNRELRNGEKHGEREKGKANGATRNVQANAKV